MKNKTGDKINNYLNPNKSGRETALVTINTLPTQLYKINIKD